MLVTFTRSILLYIIVLIVMRLMGKREIGQLQPFELVISIMIADLAATPMSNSRNSNYKWHNTNFRTISNALNNFLCKFEEHKSKRIYKW